MKHLRREGRHKLLTDLMAPFREQSKVSKLHYIRIFQVIEYFDRCIDNDGYKESRRLEILVPGNISVSVIKLIDLRGRKYVAQIYYRCPVTQRKLSSTITEQLKVNTRMVEGIHYVLPMKINESMRLEALAGVEFQTTTIANFLRERDTRTLNGELKNLPGTI